MKKERLREILMQEDVVKSINDNLYELLFLIPELKYMIGFDQKNPYHHLDVWDHTLLALSMAPLDFEIRLILLLHDIGKPHSYQDAEVRHFRKHPLISSIISQNILRKLNFNEKEIKEIIYLIKEHDTPMTEDDIKENKLLCKKRFKVQICDGLAHNPEKLTKRKIYLSYVNNILNEEPTRSMYEELLNNENIKASNIKIK